MFQGPSDLPIVEMGTNRMLTAATQVASEEAQLEVGSDAWTEPAHISWFLFLFSFFFCFCVPQLYLWGSPFWVRFLGMWLFCNPTVEVVTFLLGGWCMLGVFVASIHSSRTWIPGSFRSVRWNACVHRLDLCWNSHPKEFFCDSF